MTQPTIELVCPEFFIRSQDGDVYSEVANAILWPLSKLTAKVKE